MIIEEWGPIAALIDNEWKDEFDAVRAAAYYEALGHLSADTVREAVIRLAGARALTNPPVSAAGAYSPSAETIARECAALDYIGSWDWARRTLGRWLWSFATDHARATASWRLTDEDFTPRRREQLAALHPEHGRKLVGLVESFGLRYLIAHQGENHFLREGARRWAHLNLEAMATTTGVELVDPRAL